MSAESPEILLPSKPDYEVLNLIGHGGYGEVYLARSKEGRYCAVKVVYRVSFPADDDRPYEREYTGIRKFEPISRLSESQLQIEHVGRRDAAGYFYYIMEVADDIVSGRDIRPDTYFPHTLKSEMHRRGGRLPARQCCDIALALAIALENLHQHGLVHRDIKPANIIFVHGQPKLADPGLVTDADKSMSCAGTEGYIPPEGPGSARADIYSLGIVLYEICTGFHRRDFPKLPESLEDMPGHRLLVRLNRIISRACQANVRKRYQSARELRKDLESVVRLDRPGAPKESRPSLLLKALLGTGAAAAAVPFVWWLVFAPPKKILPDPENVETSEFTVPESAPVDQDEASLTTLVSFTDASGDAPGINPGNALVEGLDGSVYGTGSRGRSIFKVSPSGAFSALASFPRRTHLASPLIPDPASGGFFGVSSASTEEIRAGTLFRMTPAGDMTAVFSFDLKDERTAGRLVLHPADGNFYGITYQGGTNALGSVVRLTRAGEFRTLASFSKATGSKPWPSMRLAPGPAGNLFGTTTYGGEHLNGTVFSFGTNGALRTLHSFTGADGRWPMVGLATNRDGSFVGVASSGGTRGQGTVFRITSAGQFTVLALFSGTNGAQPRSACMTSEGDIYGTTARGGSQELGAIFRLRPAGELSAIFSFNGTNGAWPYELIQSGENTFYGTTHYGGHGFDGTATSGRGTLFRLVLRPERGPRGPLKRVLLSHHWQWNDVGYPSSKVRFYENGKFHDRWKWNYWITGPRTLHIQFWKAEFDSTNGVDVTFNEALTAFSGEFHDGRRRHRVSGERLEALEGPAAASP